MVSALVNEFLLNSALWLWGITAALLIFFARGNSRRRLVAGIFLAVFWVSGTSPFARAVMRPLETMYHTPTIAELQRANVKRVVVLTGGGYTKVNDLDALALPHASTFRFLAGIELCARLAPDCEIIFSGSAGSSNPQVQAASNMQNLGKTLAPQMPMTSESNSNSTAEHPQNVKPIVGDARFVLVTSAYHMPRAMMVFERAGLHAIPYPVDFYTHDGLVWNDLLPSPKNWETLNLALHEYVGMLLYLFGQGNLGNA